MRARVLYNGDTGWDIFDEKWWDAKAVPQSVTGRYVSDVITEEIINEWVATINNGRYRNRYVRQYVGSDNKCSSYYYWSVFISAQTGKGKNYFVTHTLRQYAYSNNMNILYVSNRVALDYQQKKELARLSLTSIAPENHESWKEKEEFGRVTVTTYHKLADHMKDPEWCQKFNFVVLDECHFFYSDAYFNSHTWYLLEKVVENFGNSIRIYMSGTMEEVFEPIRFFEGGVVRKDFIDGIERSLYEEIDYNPFYYEFEKDYSQYTLRFFEDEKISDGSELSETAEGSGEPAKCSSELVGEICCSGKDKWLIFVTSKDKGKKLKAAIEAYHKEHGGASDTDNFVTYIDSESRNSKNRTEYEAWCSLLERGTFESKVLIATSVLDNGFSIKDKSLKNIVLYTDDRTEFLQELGRCRLTGDEKINLYIKKTSKLDIARLSNKYNRYYDIIAQCCAGEKNLINPEIHFDGTCSTALCAARLWNCTTDERRNFFNLIPISDSGKNAEGLLAVLNMMVRWCLRRLGKSVLTFREYEKENPENAGVLFKADWLGIRVNTVGIDDDLKELVTENTITKMRNYLEQYVGEPLYEISNYYEEFVRGFRQLYEKLVGTEKINRSTKREIWGHKAMMNRLKTLEAYGIYYHFELGAGFYKLVKNLYENT